MGNERDTTGNSRIKNFFEEKEHHRAEFIVAVIVNIVLWYIANNILNWNLSFISPTFADVLGILNLLLITTVVINILFIFYHAGWFKNPLEAVTDILGLMTAYAFLTVFPFILGDVLALVLKIILVLILIASFIALIVHMAKFIHALLDR